MNCSILSTKSKDKTLIWNFGEDMKNRKDDDTAQEQARSVIRSAIKGHPVFSHMGYHEDSCGNIH